MRRLIPILPLVLGVLWSANAVNGVIDIISRRAADTRGGLAVAGGGGEEQALGALRCGGFRGTVTWRF